MADRIADMLLASTFRPVRGLVRDPARSLRPIVDAVRRHEADLRVATDEDLRSRARSMRARLRRDGFAVAAVGECFALITEAASRTLGMRHYDVQLMAGWGLLQGKLVEMATGEGKSFAATLPAAAVALAGYPVHVITVNDYLAERDAQQMAPLYGFLGLTVDSVVQGKERDDRRKAYACSIVYSTNKDVAFDYLRDGLAMTGKTSRLHLAIEQLRRGQGAAGGPGAARPVFRHRRRGRQRVHRRGAHAADPVGVGRTQRGEGTERTGAGDRSGAGGGRGLQGRARREDHYSGRPREGPDRDPVPGAGRGLDVDPGARGTGGAGAVGADPVPPRPALRRCRRQGADRRRVRPAG